MLLPKASNFAVFGWYALLYAAVQYKIQDTTLSHIVKRGKAACLKHIKRGSLCALQTEQITSTALKKDCERVSASILC